MSKAKHTPGPWKADRWENQESGDFGWSLSHKGHLVPLSTFLGEEDEAEANARLIASAPELLEALEAIVESADANSAVILTHLLWAARAAIAKATGEHP